jgi:flagellar hook-associated protein 3 FlgL
MKVSFVSSQAINQAMRYQMLRMQADLVTANKEMVTFRVADVGLALGARTGMSVSFHREIDRLKGLTDTNQLAASRLSSTQVVLQQLTADSDRLIQSFTTAFSGAGDSKIARYEAESVLASMNGLMNSHLNGEFLFAGINTDVKPMNDFLDPTSPSRIAMNNAFSTHFGFGIDSPNVADIDTTEMVQFLDDVLTPMFIDPAGGPGSGWSDWSSASDKTIQSRISLSETAQTSVSANIDPVRRLAMAAASVSFMVGIGMKSSTENAILAHAQEHLGGAVAGLANQQGYTGIAQERLVRANERMSMQTDLIKKGLNDLEGIDENEAAVNVKGLLAQIELSYSLTARMQQMSLLKYL